MRLRNYFVLLVVLWSFIYLVSTGYPPALLDDADSVHAEAAREMVESGDWITLHANRIRYLEKAPLMYWATAVSYKIWGVSEFSSRLPIALATLGLIMVTFLIGRFTYGDRAGFYSGLTIATCAGIYLFTRILWPDVILTLFIASAFYCFLRANQDEIPKPKYVYPIYIFGALAVLTKGLIGAVFPAAIIGVFLIVTGQVRRLARFRLFTGALVFLAIAAPWHLAAGFSNKGFFWFYFINEHFLRYIGKRHPADYSTVPLWLFLSLHLVWLFPWTLFLPLAMKNLPRKVRSLNRDERLGLFFVVWLALIIIFFSLSTTQEYYTMPAYPAFALLIGGALARAEEQQAAGKKSRALGATQIALAVLGLLVFAGGVTAFLMTRHAAAPSDIADTLNRNPDEYALSLGHVLDLTPQSVVALHTPIVGTAIVFLAGTITALVLRRARRNFAANLALAVMMAAFFVCARLAFTAFEPYLSSKPLAAAIEREYRDGEMIVINGEYESGSSINFYTRKMVYILNGRSSNLEYGSYFPDAPQIFLTDADIARLWSGAERIYLVTDAAERERLARLLGRPAYRFAESGGKLILTNQESNEP